MNIFQNKETHSFIHSLHPMTRVLLAAIFTVTAIAMWNPVGLAILAGYLIVLILMAKLTLSPSKVLMILAVLLVIGLLIYFGSGNTETAAASFLRFLVLLAGFPLCALTIRPEDLARSLSAMKLPHALTVSLLMTFRFIPVLFQESKSILEAEALRGNQQKKSASWWRSRLIPFTFTMMDYCDQTTVALELRGFDLSANRTLYRKPQYGWRDGVVLLITITVITLAVLAPTADVLFS